MFSWFLLLIEVNAWEDEWLVSIGTLQEGKKKANKRKKQKKKQQEQDLKKWSSLLAIHQYFQNGWKLKWAKLKKPYKHWFLKLIIIVFPFFM